MTSGRRNTRFSLLLLQDAEVLLSDLAVHYHFLPTTATSSPSIQAFPPRLVKSSSSTSVRGRVKLATHSLLFDSDDWRNPVIRLPLDSIASATAHGHNVQNSSTCVLVVASAVTLQRELAVDHPYKHLQLQGHHVFTPLYSSARSLLDDINSLLHITASVSAPLREEQLTQFVRQREAQTPFDITVLQHGVRETEIMEAPASAVYAMSRQPGRFRLTRHNIYFMPIHCESSQAVERIPLTCITSIRMLRHGCRNGAVEVGYKLSSEHAVMTSKTKPCSTLMLSFASRQVRNHVVSCLRGVVKHSIQTYDQRELDAAVASWRAGTMSNFEYLMHLNLTAGRSFNDLSQYPVFPWVVQDYSSATLDLNNPKTFRDLSRPIGALNQTRLESFRQRYVEMPAPRFLYGTHYSTPAYVIHYLVRAAPGAMLRLQNGRFDAPDRLFHSIESTWESVLQNRGDVKELIPEFYALEGATCGVICEEGSAGAFLDNVHRVELGRRQDGVYVDNVKLPRWAKGRSEIFIAKMAEALESEFVSGELHKWIDLIFGTKSRSAEDDNVFYTDVMLPSSIEEEKEKMVGEREMKQIETVYLEFGRTPEQLFRHGHVRRFSEREGVGEIAIDAESKEEGEEGGVVKRKKSRGIILERMRKIAGLDVERMRKIAGLAGLDLERQYVIGTFFEATGDDACIVDMCVIEDEDGARWEWKEASDVVLCTLWSSGHMLLHSGKRTVRSKIVEGACVITYGGKGCIVFGCVDGWMGWYDFERGRVEMGGDGAWKHDGEVRAVEWVKELDVVVSGSKDGSVRVGRMGCGVAQEVDAEGAVEDVCGRMEGDDGLLVGGLTEDEEVLVWRVKIGEGKGGGEFVQPIWRREFGDGGRSMGVGEGRVRGRMEWVGTGLIGVSDWIWGCVRVWRVGEGRRAEIGGGMMRVVDRKMDFSKKGEALEIGCYCLGKECGGRVLVGAGNGRVWEMNEHAVWIGGRNLGRGRVQAVHGRADGSGLVVWDELGVRVIGE